MAQLIKPDGTEQEVKPKNGVEFTLDELRAYVEGHIEAIPYTSSHAMYVHDESALIPLPYNAKASQLLKEKQPNRVHTDVYGNALIASLQETGDEDNTLHVQATPINAACTECGKSPALEWNMYGMTGILCQECLAREVDNANLALQTGLAFNSQDFLEALDVSNWHQTDILHTPTMEVKYEDGQLEMTLPDCQFTLDREQTIALARFLADHVKLPPVEPIEDFPDDFQAKRVDTEQEEG